MRSGTLQHHVYDTVDVKQGTAGDLNFSIKLARSLSRAIPLPTLQNGPICATLSPMKLSELAALTAACIDESSGDVEISGAAGLDDARDGDVSFLANPR